MPASQAAPDQYDSHDGGAGTATAVEGAPGNGQAARAEAAKDILAKCKGAFMEARIAMKQVYYPYFLPLA